MTDRILVILGAGPGLGAGAARRFAREGFASVLIGASAEAMTPVVETLAAEGVTAHALGVDLLDAADITRAVEEAAALHGRIDVLHFNPSAWRQKDPLTLTAAELLEDVMFGTAALLPAVQAALSHFAEGARVLVTGSAAADTPWHEAASLGVQKAGVRNLVTSLDAALKDRGARAVAVQINGALAREGAFSPEPIAEAFWAAVSRSDDDWKAHVSYDG